MHHHRNGPGCQSRRRSAYTLIELLLVVALLGIAAAMVVPKVSATNSLMLQAAVRLIVADLSFAQSDALAHQEFRRLAFMADGSGYALVQAVQYPDFDDPFDADTADYVQDPLKGAIQNGNYVIDYITDGRFNGVSIASAEFDGTDPFVTFDALGGTVIGGGLPGTGGRVVVALEDLSYEIIVSPFTGKVTVNEL